MVVLVLDGLLNSVGIDERKAGEREAATHSMEMDEHKKLDGGDAETPARAMNMEACTGRAEGKTR